MIVLYRQSVYSACAAKFKQKVTRAMEAIPQVSEYPMCAKISIKMTILSKYLRMNTLKFGIWNLVSFEIRDCATEQIFRQKIKK